MDVECGWLLIYNPSNSVHGEGGTLKLVMGPKPNMALQIHHFCIRTDIAVSEFDSVHQYRKHRHLVTVVDFFSCRIIVFVHLALAVRQVLNVKLQLLAGF
jgi:hypothetical protein